MRVGWDMHPERGPGLASVAGRQGNTYFYNVSPHATEKWLNVADRARADELAIVEPETDPQIVHEHRKPKYHRRHAHRSTKLIPGLNVSGRASGKRGRNIRLMLVESRVGFFARRRRLCRPRWFSLTQSPVRCPVRRHGQMQDSRITFSLFQMARRGHVIRS